LAAPDTQTLIFFYKPWGMLHKNMLQRNETKYVRPIVVTGIGSIHIKETTNKKMKHSKHDGVQKWYTYNIVDNMLFTKTCEKQLSSHKNLCPKIND
jgi:hypothetical protein